MKSFSPTTSHTILLGASMFLLLLGKSASLLQNPLRAHARSRAVATTAFVPQQRLQSNTSHRPSRLHPRQATRDASTSSTPPSTTATTTTNIQIPTWVPDEQHDENTGYSRPVIQWYPGHIAKAERRLKETFQAVDVVVEVRDARASKATSHPKVSEWVGAGRPRLVVFTHVDLVPTASMRAWKQHYEIQLAGAQKNSHDDTLEDDTELPKQQNANNNNEPVQFLWVNAKQGQGVQALHRAIFKAGAYVQERRQRRGLKDRPLRVGLMGYPNVGKSALINRLLGRKRAKTANLPGVTRSLQWIRVRTDDSKKTGKKEYELLDSPGIIPASLDDQSDALLLAACHCIGEASYDNQVVASYLCQWMQNLMITGKDVDSAPGWRENSKKRWGIDPLKPVPVEEAEDTAGLPKNNNNNNNNNNENPAMRYITGEEILYMVADNKCKTSVEDAARKILQDFRTGRMGDICLQLAPPLLSDDNDASHASDFSQVPDPRMGTMRIEGMASASWNDWEHRRDQQEAATLERAKNARDLAKERGLELPPQLDGTQQPETSPVATVETTAEGGNSDTKNKKQIASTDDIGKGLFDGW